MEHQKITLSHPRYQFLPGLTGLYLHIWLRDVGRGLIAIFIPLYVYKLTGSLALPFIMHALYQLMVVLGVFWQPKLIQKIGLDRSAALGAVFRTGSLIFFILAGKSVWFLPLAFIFWGMAIHFTWIPHHYTVLQADDGDEKYGKESSKAMVAQKLAEIASPFAGGLIVSMLGFNWLYVLALFFVTISALPLFLDRIEKKDMHWNLTEFKKDLFSFRQRHLNLGFIGEGLEGTIPFWPLFIYLYLGKVEKVGMITSVSMLVAVLALYLLGKYTDKRGKGWAKKFFFGLTAVWLLRPFFRTVLGFTLIDSFYYIFYSFMMLGVYSYIYEFAHREHKFQFLVRREFLIHLAGSAGCLLMALAISMDFWLLGFLLAAGGVWLMKNAVYRE